ncbi:hypothetical protein W03_07250 [Nitrosomonas sp. PY1]|uniref:hypothetical protein n=1 Tax=Nitrosomonas sp. PY1 TaxID=1803906 RepID=UPI001FC85605|nr:hypothetical protein [Nitrosomonas sp. PY1]GKS68721.1 hypothetical protein W03_07250 [Nitrosomonas sp. PY1]
MSIINKSERAKQSRIVNLFCEQFGYTCLGRGIDGEFFFCRYADPGSHCEKQHRRGIGTMSSGIKANQEAVSETIENNVRSHIIKNHLLFGVL